LSRDPSTTYRLSDMQAAAVESVRRRAARRIALVVYHEGGVETAVLETGVPLVVGRRPPSDLSIADPSLSRTHARFTLAAADRVRVEDLGSTNGIRLGGERVSSTEVGPGGEVVLGHVLVCA
jgi:two-component system, NtrC family, response regulator AtoC